MFCVGEREGGPSSGPDFILLFFSNNLIARQLGA